MIHLEMNKKDIKAQMDLARAFSKTSSLKDLYWLP